MKKKSMFYKPARHRELGDIVSLESPAKARKSARTLLSLFKKAKRRDRKRRIKQAAVLAANRAKASAKRTHLGKKEKREYEEIADIYTEVYKEMEL